MDNLFFEQPILNSPYDYPARHWELDDQGQPTQRITETRRLAKFITPIPKPRKQKGKPKQQEFVFDEGIGLSTESQRYDTTSNINELRFHVERWRLNQNRQDWQVTPETARLLQHWRQHAFSSVRPFFCQVEAVETVIWLTEVAPHSKAGKDFLEYLANANNDANPGLMRLALKLATGAGKTTVMAMLIAWQTINAVRRPDSKKYTRGFLIVTPGLTIRDRLRVLQPNDPDSYYASRELVPHDMWDDINRAKIVITNYHAFKLRERIDISKDGRSLLQGRGEALNTLETEGQMIQRNLWEYIGQKMPKKGRGQAKNLDPLSLPVELQTALEALYGHYEKTFYLWEESGISVPPCFIVVCNNTSTSKLVYDYISGFFRENEDGSTTLENGRLALFRNFDEHGNQFARPCTLLIDSEQLESGDALDDNFRAMAGDEIARFRREIIERTGDLLCEQVIGRALRRQSYDLNEEGLFNVEYADILGIPFDFSAEPVIAKPQKPRETIQVKAVRPERDLLEVTFPRVMGYRVELPEERLTADFNADSVLELSPELIGPSITKNSGIIGADVDLNLKHLEDLRQSSVLFHITKRLLYTKWRDPGEDPMLHLFGQLKRITKQWLDTCLVCTGGTYPAQLMQADSRKCHINWVILDSDWEAEFCRVAESHPRVKAYVKNQNLGLEVPYRYGSNMRIYLPDFIAQVNDGHSDPLNLIVEIKGYRREDAKEKKSTMETYWVQGVNNLGIYGRWAFAEFTAVYEIDAEFNKLIDSFAAQLVA